MGWGRQSGGGEVGCGWWVQQLADICSPYFGGRLPDYETSVSKMMRAAMTQLFCWCRGWGEGVGGVGGMEGSTAGGSQSGREGGCIE